MGIYKEKTKVSPILNNLIKFFIFTAYLNKNAIKP